MDAVNCKIVNTNGDEVGTVNLAAAVFAAPIKAPLVFDTVVWQRNKKRAGTHSVITKGEMKGGGRKPWRQKGTGRARAGSNTSPVWVGGAIAHGPKPHGYESRLSKRSRREALASALSSKAKDGLVVVFDKLEGTAKSKAMREALKKAGVGSQSALIVLKDKNDAWRASSNLAKVCVCEPHAVNVYDVMRHKYLVFTVDGIEALQAVLTGRQNKNRQNGKQAA